MKRNRVRSALLAAAIFPAIGHQFTEAATTYFWNNSFGGSGNWDTSTQDWSTTAAGPNNYTWTNSGSELADFGGTGGVVTLIPGGVTSSGLIFTTGGYTLTGGPLTLTGASISANGAETIASQIKGTVGLTKTGSGTLTLTGTNTYSGTTSVAGSYLIASADASGQPLSTGPMTLAGAGLRLNGINSNTITTVGNFTVNALSTTFPGASNLIIDNTAGSGGGFTTTLAAGNLARGSTGTVLGITPVTGSLGTGEVITLTNGSSSLINGILPVWVAAQTSPSNTAVDFLGYGANGVTAASYSSTDLTTSTNSSVVNQSTTPTIAGDVSAYALKTTQSIDLHGHTLTLGNGSGQSGLILNSGGQITDGSVTFGSTEGIVYVQGNGTIGSGGSTITANGLTINGSGASTSLLIDGNYVTASGSNPIYNTVTTSGTTATFGAAPGSSTMSLSNAAPVIFAPAAGATIAVNDVMQDPSGGMGSVEYSGNSQTTATIKVNGANTYTGGTTFNTGATVQFTTDSNAAGTTGPFGAGSLLMNNTNNDLLQPFGGGSRTVSNPITLNFGFTVGNASGDSTGLSLTGPITFLAAGRTMTDNFASGATLTLGSAATPSTITLPSGVAQTSILIGAGAGIINDTIQDPNSGANAGTLSVQSTGNWTFNGPINGDGTLAITAASNVTLNGVKNGAGGLRSSGGGTITFNSQNTYSGGSTFSGGGTVVNILKSSNALPGSGFTSGPFGTGSITFNNGTNQHLRPTGAQTISNSISMITGFAMDTATGDSTSSLTFTGAITEAAGGKFISDGFATPPAGFTGTAAMILGDPSAPSTIAIFNNATLAGAIAGPLIVNDVIKDPSSGVGTVALDPSTPQDSNTITLNAQNTYSGGTALSSGAAGFGTILINANAVGTPGSITSGPFGTGTINALSASTPGVLSPIGADRTIPNPFNLTTAGFWVANSATAPFNLTLSGTITLNTAGRTITNQMVSGSALILGSSASPTAIIDPSSLTFQTQLAAGTGGTTIINDPISGSGFVNAQINAVVNLQGTNSYTGGTSVQTGAKLTTNTNLSNGTITLTAGTSSFGGMATVMAQPTAGATAGVTSVPALSIDSLSKLDITNNGMIVQSNTPFATVQGYILSGMANNFTGNGITSSRAASVAADSSNIHKTAVGYATVAELGNPSTFLSVSITDSNSTLVRYTLEGDTDLSGQVTSTDFSNLAAHYGQTGADWFDGDFNGDGTVNALDFNALATNYGAPLSSAIPDDAAMAPAASLGTLVPEPTTLSLVGLSLLALRRRRTARPM